MKHDLDDRYEPETEYGWCSHCKQECTIIGIDEGVGPYEFQGQRGTHIDIRAASDCCESEVLNHNPSEN